MTKLLKDHIITLLDKNMREDKRTFDEFRQPIIITPGISNKSAEGSAHVRIGDTEVVAGVKLDVGEPFPDTPDEGTLMVGAELLPLSNPNFESGPPDILAIELARVVDRGIRESKAIDLKKLCIKKGEKVWMVYVDIYPLNDAGNLFDAAALAAIAALKDTRFPEYNTKEDTLNYEKRTNKPLPLTKTPIMLTVIKIKNTYLLDPTDQEWDHLDARLSVAVLEDNTLVALQKGGDAPLTFNDVENMITLAQEKTPMLRKLLP